MADPTHVRHVIMSEIAALFTEEGDDVPDLADDDVLLDSGLDSLGFAVLVTRLEDSLGYDPFTEMEEPVYPQTLADFIQVYTANAPAQ